MDSHVYSFNCLYCKIFVFAGKLDISLSYCDLHSSMHAKIFTFGFDLCFKPERASIHVNHLKLARVINLFAKNVICCIFLIPLIYFCTSLTFQ